MIALLVLVNNKKKYKWMAASLIRLKRITPHPKKIHNPITQNHRQAHHRRAAAKQRRHAGRVHHAQQQQHRRHHQRRIQIRLRRTIAQTQNIPHITNKHIQHGINPKQKSRLYLRPSENQTGKPQNRQLKRKIIQYKTKS